MLLAAVFVTSLAAAPSPAPALVNVIVAPTTEADDITPTLEDVPGLISVLVQSVKDKNYQLMVAMIVLLLVLAVNTLLLKFKILSDKARKLALPWIAAGTACLMVFASTLLAGGDWGTALLTGFATGAAATGLWELVFRHVKKALAKKPAGSGD